MRQLALLTIVVVSSFNRVAGQAAAPHGWSATNKRGAWVYKPIRLPRNRDFSVTVERPQPLHGEDLGDWYEARFTKDEAKRGKLELSKALPGNHYGEPGELRIYGDTNVDRWAVSYFAIPLPRDRVLFCCAASSRVTEDATGYFHTAGQICGAAAIKAGAKSPISQRR